MPALEIFTPDGHSVTLQLGDKRIKLGRADWCDFVMRNDAEVSREHAEIWLDEHGRVLVEDRGSKNGTRVDDGEPFKNSRRFAHRTIRIGEHSINVIGAPPPDKDDQLPVVFMADPTPGMGDTQFFPSSRRLDLNQQRLALLIQLAERIGGVFDRKQLLEQALDACCEALGFERGLIALKTQRGDPELPVTRNIERDETGAFRVSRTLINRALIDGERAIVNNPATDLAGNLTESMVRFPICSALCVPIMNRNEILGVIYGDRVAQAFLYQPEDVDFLAAIAQQVGVGLANLRLFYEHVKAQRVYAELEQARHIQRKLLPAAPLEIGKVRIEGVNVPSSAVSGDYFDYFPLDDGRVGIIIADVTGHGLPAALVMANLQSAVRVALAADLPLPALGAQLNHLIYHNTDAHVFVTAILGTVNTQTGLMEYISAGHPPPILVGPRHARELTEYSNCLPLGVEAHEEFVTQHVQLKQGETTALFFTDGVTEASNRDGVLLGVRPVVAALSKLREAGTNIVCEITRRVVNEHQAGATRVDDMTLLAVQLVA